MLINITYRIRCLQGRRSGTTERDRFDSVISVVVSESIDGTDNNIPLFWVDVISYPFLDLSLYLLVKGAPWGVIIEKSISTAYDASLHEWDDFDSSLLFPHYKLL